MKYVREGITVDPGTMLCQVGIIEHYSALMHMQEVDSTRLVTGMSHQQAFRRRCTYMHIYNYNYTNC